MANTSKPKFDPTQPFEAVDKPAFDPNKPTDDELSDQQKYGGIVGAGSAGLSSALNTASLGQWPKLQAGVDYLLQKSQGKNPSYGDLQQGYEGLADKLAKTNPTSSYLGKVPGMAAQIAMMGPVGEAGEGAGLLRQSLGNAAVGGMMNSASANASPSGAIQTALTAGLLPLAPAAALGTAKAVLPHVGSLLAGIPADATRAMLETPSSILSFDSPQGAKVLADQVGSAIGTLKGKGQDTWKSLMELLGGLEKGGATVSTQGAANAFDQEISNLANQAQGTNLAPAKLRELNSLIELKNHYLRPTPDSFDPIWGQRTSYAPGEAAAGGGGEIGPKLLPGGGPGGALPPGSAPQLQNGASGPQINLPRDVTNVADPLRAGLPLFPPNVSNQLPHISSEVADVLRARGGPPPNMGGTATAINPEVIPANQSAAPGQIEGPAIDMNKTIHDYIAGLQRTPGKYEVTPTSAAGLLKSMNDVSKPGESGLLQNAATGASTALSQSQITTMNKAAASLSENLKSLHPDVRQAYEDYAKVAELSRQIGRRFDDSGEIYSTLQGMGSNSKDTLVKQLGGEIGPDQAKSFNDAATKIRALQAYGAPENDPRLSFGQDARAQNPYLASALGRQIDPQVGVLARLMSSFGKPVMRGTVNATNALQSSLPQGPWWAGVLANQMADATRGENKTPQGNASWAQGGQ